MRIIIDTNRIMAVLIKDSMSRAILFNNDFEFFTPEHAVNEIIKYKKELCKKAGINEKDFSVVFYFIMEKIKIVPKSEFESFISESKKLIQDESDVPFIALCLHLKANGVWSHDKHFMNQKKVKIFMTSDMINLAR